MILYIFHYMNPTLRNVLLYRIISPHGITDLIHSQNTKDMAPLFKAYGFSFGLHWILPKAVLPFLFFMSSVVHFRHDFNVLSTEWKKYICSASLLGMFWKAPPDFFFYYMAIIHVPQHYIRCWPFVHSSPFYTLGLLYSLGSILETHPTLLTQYPVVFQSIIIGHVLYHEYNNISSMIKTFKPLSIEHSTHTPHDNI